ncbi:MAG TPA: tetratricopeptide repeat protein [Bryobacteraceae bacterium]|jgi:tetratricopeptide (TPR) repeat protein/DNA-binding winged helix-turn-helix (wHTH) protein
MSSAAVPLVYRIEGMEVDVARGVLIRDGSELHLKPRAFQLLLHLIGARDRLVPKEELMSLLWKDAVVTDDVLTQCVGELRRTLRDDARNPRYLKTVPKRGYRFIADVEEVRPALAVVRQEVTTVEIQQTYVDEGEPLPALLPQKSVRPRSSVWVAAVATAALIGAAAGWFAIARPNPPAPAPVPGKRQLVVLPFENQSGQSDLDWLRDGLADMLTATLTRSPSIDVLSREQAALWIGRLGKSGLPAAIEVARHSHAGIAVTGSFARLGSEIRVDAQIYDGRTGKLLAADGVTAGADQVLHQVEYLGARLSNALRASVAPGDLASAMTNSLEAWRDYENGLRLIESVQTDEGIRLLEKAIALDPNFGMAYARIGYAHAVDGTDREAGLPYLRKAFEMGDRLSPKNRQHVLAWYALAKGDYQAAIRCYQELVAAYPNEIEAYYRLGNLLRGESRHAEAISVIRQAIALDPEDPKLYNGLATYHSELGHHREAIEAARQFVALAPNDPNAYDSLGLAYQFAGQYRDALAAMNQALARNAGFALAHVHRATLYWQMGRQRDALREELERASAGVSLFYRTRYWEQAAMQYWRLDQRVAARSAVTKVLSLQPRGYVTRNPALVLLPHPPDAAPIQGRGARFGLRSEFFYLAARSRANHQPDEMLENLRQTVRFAPAWGSGELLEDALADGYRELGRWEEAIAEYRRALGVFPGMGLARFHLAQALEHQGREEEAKTEYRRFLEVWRDADMELPAIREARAAIR